MLFVFLYKHLCILLPYYYYYLGIHNIKYKTETLEIIPFEEEVELYLKIVFFLNLFQS
jgi:hypothetical protein